MLDILRDITLQSWLVLGQMAPYLLFGFLAAGVLSVCIPPAWVERHLGGRGLGPALKASLFGVPLPLCSCSVIPVSASIHRHGASRSATTAFLLSTPQTGVDSIAVTYALLGPVFAIFRPIAALLTGLVGGALVQLFDESDGSDAADEPQAAGCTEPCCEGATSQNVVLRVLHYGFVTLPRDIGVALLVGILIAGAMAVLVPENWLHAYIGAGVLSMVLLMAAGIPVYVCATASVPIAVGLIHLGASPGAALAFLIAGPATNAATFTTIWRLLGRRTAVLYLITVALSAMAAGLTLDWLMPAVERALPQMAMHVHESAEGGWLRHLGAVVLLAVMAMAFAPKVLARLTRGNGDAKARPARPSGGAFACPTDGMAPAADQQRLELSISGMTCNHCADMVRRALAQCSGVRSAEVNLADGRAVITGEQLDLAQLVAAAEELGYTANVPAQSRTGASGVEP